MNKILSRRVVFFGAAFALSTGVFAAAPAKADDAPLLVIHNHQFTPTHLVVPAGARFKLRVRNDDATAEEFESEQLDREKVVPAGKTVKVYLGPLKAGDYKFWGDYHQATAQGVLTAK